MRIVQDDKAEDGFWWVEALTVNGRPSVESLPTQDKLTGLWGEWLLRATAKTPLFVGSGEAELDNDRVAFRFARTGDAYAIPGASLKGVFRSMVELLSPSCLLEPEGRECRCPACCIFGALGRKGRVSFDDAPVTAGPRSIVRIAQRTTPRRTGPNGVDGVFRKLYARTAAGSKPLDQFETVEALPTASFPIRARFERMELWELGLLMLAMGVFPGARFNVKCGGAKNRACGLVQIDWADGRCAEGRAWFLGDRNPFDRRAAADAFLEKAGKKWGLTQEIQQLVGALMKEYPYA